MVSTTYKQKLVMYGYIDEDIRVTLFATYYKETEESFINALTKARNIKKKLTTKYQKIEIFKFLEVSTKIE